MSWKLVYHVPRSQVWEGSRGGQTGAVHLHTDEDVDLGRIRRRPGQPLCGKRPWYPRPIETEADRGLLHLRCSECSRRAERYGIDWPEWRP